MVPIERNQNVQRVWQVQYHKLDLDVDIELVPYGDWSLEVQEEEQEKKKIEGLHCSPHSTLKKKAVTF